MFLLPISHRRAHLAHAFDRFFDDTVFERVAAPAKDNGTTARCPALDVAETDGGYTVKLDMPGVAKDDVKIDVEGRRVSVQAQQASSSEQTDGERVLYSERREASWARSFVLPAEVEQASSSARLDNGVLTLQLAKRSASKAAQITVN